MPKSPRLDFSASFPDFPTYTPILETKGGGERGKLEPRIENQVYHIRG